MRTAVLVSLLWLAGITAARAQEQVVTPTVVGRDKVCWSQVPCEPTPCDAVTPCPQVTPPPCPTGATPCDPARPVVHMVMRSKPLFWAGAGLAAAGVTFIVGAMTWARDSEPTTLPTFPCGTDPYFAQKRGIAPCKVSAPLLAAGASLAGTGALLMFIGSERIAVGADGRQITVRVRF